MIVDFFVKKSQFLREYKDLFIDWSMAVKSKFDNKFKSTAVKKHT